MGTRSASLQVVVSGAVVAGATVSGAVVAFDPHADKTITATINKHITFHKLPFIGFSPPCTQNNVESLSQMYVLMNRPSGKSLALSLASVQPHIIYQLDSVQFLEAKLLFLPYASRFTKVTIHLHVFPKAPPPFLSQQAILARSCDETGLAIELIT
jgi:hypothetical protein